MVPEKIEVSEPVLEKPGRWLLWRPHLVAFLFYTGLTLIFAWPAIVNLGIGTPGNFPVDRNQNLWNFWWFKRSLLETHTNPYETGFLFFPYGARLYLHTFSPYNLIFGLPLQLLFGLIPTYGFIELLTFPLGGYCGYLLGRFLVKDEWGALLTGLVWSFGAYHYVELRQEQLNLLSLQWLPVVILFMFKLEQSRSRKELIQNGLLAAFFFFLTLLVDYYYATYLIMFAGLFWLWQLGWYLAKRWAGHIPGKEMGRNLAVLTAKMAAIFVPGMLLLSPILLATVKETASPDYIPLNNTGSDQVHSADLATIFLPPSHQPWWGSSFGFWKFLGIKEVDGVAFLNGWGAVLGYVAVILSIYALLKIRHLWFWLFNAVFWVLLSFGPALRINGDCPGNNCGNWPMPYRLVSKLPFIGIGRFPERYMLMAQLSFAVLGAYGLAHLLRRLPAFSARPRLPVRALGGCLALALFFFENWPGILPPPRPLNQAAFTAAIAASKTESLTPARPAILELPVTFHSNPDSSRMFSQIYHQRPITGGYISRKLVDPHRVAHDYALYDWLELRANDQDIIPVRTQQEQLGLLNYARMGFVVLYPDEFTGSSAALQLQRAQRLLSQTFAPAKPFFQDSQTTIYLVPSVSLGHPVIVLGQGWQEVEKAGNNQVQRWIAGDTSEAHLNIVIGPEVALKDRYRLELTAASPDKPRRLQLFLNGNQLEDLKVEGLKTFQLENLKLQPGDNIISLRPDPADGVFIPPKDNRELKISVLAVKLN